MRNPQTILLILANLLLLMILSLMLYNIFGQPQERNSDVTEESSAPEQEEEVEEVHPTSTPASIYPSEILNLTNWKITLPVGSSEKPTEIKQPELDEYQIPPWFIALEAPQAVRFRAPVNAVTTSGSG